MRVLAIDVGQRRVGLAISDRSRTLARPLATVAVTPGNLVQQIAAEVRRLAAEEDGVAEILVGLPVRLDGSPNEQTASVTAFIEALRRAIAIPVVAEDERLTSHEADTRLAATEPDWRKRKPQLDAAAAAVILQDYLDRGRAPRRGDDAPSR
jgi:putative Holliday junction resolvase